MRFATLSLAVLAAGLMAACSGGSSNSSKTKAGYSYTVHNHKEGARTIQQGDIVLMHVTQRTGTDSILGSTRMPNAQSGQTSAMPILVPVDTTLNPMAGPNPFRTLLLAAAVGDSVDFVIPADSLFKVKADSVQPDSVRPKYFRGKGSLKLSVKVLRVESAKERDARTAKEMTDIAAKGNFETLEGGVLVQTITPGTGPKAAPGDTLLIDYTGTLVDTLVSKKPFDSSINPPQPGRSAEPLKMVVSAGMVIRGWDIAFLSIPEGAKAKIIIPYALAYGEQGAPGAIPPFSNLIFDVNVRKVIKGKGMPKPPTAPQMPGM
jgi:FKBP-type peptidyl-prolyl cis-trans isomerase FkpA